MNKFYRSDDKKNILLNLVSLDGGEKGIALEALKANTSDGAAEKHVPVVSINGNTVEVAIGSVAHPMLEEHYITGIYIETTSGGQFASLKPGEEPKAVFLLKDGDEFIAAYEYCNLHGLWKAGK
ncbi:desulfoferrodoxin family protein [[Clostridium] symbiosum]|uniref:desulfoferrodoxin family protein n=1 Tax=Clostridium symbiosum TaxID=1512 RepID=UPI001D06DDAB|nr:desulfoferrodoxin family protein [[Clostridium] symbiosum]MCB6610751.1 desulfoferrodoxin [[Clostridium] symbiosum]MCB6931770.1 desulfoferrodoxin [[Clostridium] symbiosum]